MYSRLLDTSMYSGTSLRNIPIEMSIAVLTVTKHERPHSEAIVRKFGWLLMAPRSSFFAVETYKEMRHGICF